MRAVRRQMQYVFQDPYSSLNPMLSRSGRSSPNRCASTVSTTAMGGAALHRASCSTWSGCRRTMLEPLPARVLRRPEAAHRHRACACAASRDCSSSTSRSRRSTCRSRRRSSICCRTCSASSGLAYLFIAHDLSVVQPHLGPRRGDVSRPHRRGEREDALYGGPTHPYTQSLLSAVPVPDPAARSQRRRIVLQGEIPNPASPPSGCPFHPALLPGDRALRRVDAGLRALSGPVDRRGLPPRRPAEAGERPAAGGVRLAIRCRRRHESGPSRPVLPAGFSRTGARRRRARS